MATLLSTTDGIAGDEHASRGRCSAGLRAAIGIVNGVVLGGAFWSLVVLWWIAWGLETPFGAVGACGTSTRSALYRAPLLFALPLLLAGLTRWADRLLRLPTLRLYRFRFRDVWTGKWVQARYRAEAIVIRMRHPEHELLDVEVREVDGDGLRYFNPHPMPGAGLVQPLLGE